MFKFAIISIIKPFYIVYLFLQNGLSRIKKQSLESQIGFAFFTTGATGKITGAPRWAYEPLQ